MKNIINKIRQQCDNWFIKCNDWCFECCGVIIFSKEEDRLMKKELLKQGLKTPPNWKWNKYCEYLTTEWKCSVYNQRPVICRMFGIVDSPKAKCIILKDRVNLIKETLEMKKYWFDCMNNWVCNDNAKSILVSIYPELWENL
jgi:Fe-S-cluster containining protein